MHKTQCSTHLHLHLHINIKSIFFSTRYLYLFHCTISTIQSILIHHIPTPTLPTLYHFLLHFLLLYRIQKIPPKFVKKKAQQRRKQSHTIMILEYIPKLILQWVHRFRHDGTSTGGQGVMNSIVSPTGYQNHRLYVPMLQDFDNRIIAIGIVFPLARRAASLPLCLDFVSACCCCPSMFLLLCY